MLFCLLLTACTPTASYKTADIQALAQTVKPDDIIMYSTPDCMYCNQAKGWLNVSIRPYPIAEVAKYEAGAHQYPYLYG